jgi:hypothetical protein
MLKSIFSALAAIPFAAMAANAQRPPSNGQEVLQRMHDAYAGRWYKSLTFRQQTTQWRPDGTSAVSTWLESLRYTPEIGAQLRIDIGDLAAGNGVLYTADSTFVIRAAKLTTTRPQGNEFLPLIEGVYLRRDGTTGPCGSSAQPRPPIRPRRSSGSTSSATSSCA